MNNDPICSVPLAKLIELEEKSRIAQLGSEKETRMELRKVHRVVSDELNRRKRLFYARRGEPVTGH